MSFVRSSENSLGIGKLLESERSCARIEYFSSPCHKPTVVEVEMRTIRPVTLDEQTRVYYLDPAGEVWRSGRSLIATEAGEYVVAFPNHILQAVCCDRLFVRCD